MIDNLIIVAGQVAILFILIALGFVCGKTKLINETGAKHLTDIVLYLATPCIMIQSFQRVKYDSDMAFNLLVSFLCAVLIQGLSIIVCRLIFRSRDLSRRKVLRFGAVFSNCGFMSLPLQQAVLGTKGVFYGAVFVAVFNILVWSYGFIDMSGENKISIKRIILNPGVLGAAAAAALFFLKLQLPELLSSPISYIAALNTPVPMLVIGFHLSQTNFKKYLADPGIYALLAVRLAAIPLVSLFAMLLCGVNRDILVACTIASSAPVAATTTMFATKFNRDVELSVGMVSISTVASIATMPLIIALAQSI